MSSHTIAETASLTELQSRIADLERRLVEAEGARAEELREELRQQLDITRTITSTTADAVFMTDRERRLTFVNPAGERMFGFTFDELRGRSLHAMIHHKRPDGRPFAASECPLGRLYKTSEATHDHHDVFFRKDGTPVYVSVSNAAVFQQEQIIATVVIVRDISDAELARRELTPTNERLESALATAQLGIWNTNFATGQTNWDAQMKSFFGLAPGEEITVAEGEEFIHPDDRSLKEEILQPRPEPNGEIEWEWRVIPRSGETRWHQSRANVTRDQTGRVISARGVTRDITDQKNAHEAQEMLAAIVESSEDSIASWTLQGIVTSWNRGAQATFGYAPAEIIGGSAAILVPPERAGELEMLLVRVARGEPIKRHQTERLTKDGRRIIVSMTISPMRNQAGRVTGASVVIRDVTREKQLEEKLRQAEKMEAIGQLAGGIAHDFNNLLTIVNGYAEMALTNVTDESAREQLATIHTAGERATALTSQLLAFSRKQMLQLQIVNINTIVAAMYPLLRRVIREDIECALKLDPALSSVKVDPVQIEQVLLNLAINASDAIASRGRILIETKNVTLDHEYSQMHPESVPGNYVMLAVSDNGTGIEPAIQARIFEPFFTTKPPGKGTGLGLSMVYRFSRQSGGHVTCYSEPGFGTTFAVYLPADENAVSPVYPPAQPEPASVRGTETVLVVEDDDALRAYAVRALRGLGYMVHEAADGKQAIDLWGMNPESLDLLITDMVMPVIGGRELASILRNLSARLKVLYVSGYSDNPAALGGDGVAFLAKPYSTQQLARKVREVLATA